MWASSSDKECCFPACPHPVLLIGQVSTGMSWDAITGRYWAVVVVWLKYRVIDWFIRFGSSSPITLTVFAPWVLIQCSDPNFLSSWEMWSPKFCNTVEYIWQIQASCLLIEHTPKFQVRFYNAFETKHAPEAFPRSQLAHWTDILCVCEVFCPSWEEWPGVLGVPDCRPSWWLDVKYLANFKRTSTIKNLICAKPI